MLISWLVFPLVLAALSAGWGWLLQAATRTRIPPALVPGAGMAAIVVAGQFLTIADATAELATPVIAAVGAAGLAFGVGRRLGRPSGWALMAAGGVFAVLAAPVVLSGEATFAGFVKLDDTATWMALTDRVMEHGRDLDGLEPSTYEATLEFNLADGYPVGVFVPLGVGAALVGQDLAWVVQPYIALWGALLALALWQLARRPVADHRVRAAVAFVAAQPALLVGYYLWGGIKEVAAAALIATIAGLLPEAVSRGHAVRVAPAAIGAAALVGAVSGGGVLWLLPLLGVAAFVAVRSIGVGGLAGRAAVFAAIALAGSLPVLLAGALLPPTSSPLTDSGAVGNLAGPLDVAQVAGIWPAGDFRFEPDAPVLTYALVVVAVAGAVLWTVTAWRRRSWQSAAFVGGTLASAAVIGILGSPWVEAKALATASIVVPFGAMLAAAALWTGGWRAVGGSLALLVAGGVLWSNALAYRSVNLAPRDQLAELEEIGRLIKGEGPTLMTEYNPYGARHFLRAGDPEGVSELRRRRVPLESGGAVPKGLSADTDELTPDGLLVYRSLVVRRSPARSRPPSPYGLAWEGEHYELWQRPAGPPPQIERLPLGFEHDPTAPAPCTEVRRLAAAAGEDGSLLAVPGPRPVVIALGEGLSVRTDVPSGRYEAWLEGSIRGKATLRVDGREVSSARHVLNNEGGYLSFGSLQLEGGPAELAVELAGPDLHPGSGGPQPEVGPLVFGPARAEPEPFALPVSRAGELCGQRLDWVEAVTR